MTMISNTLINIANSIREKTSTTDRMTLTQMPDLIRSIEGGASDRKVLKMIELYVLLPHFDENSRQRVFDRLPVHSWDVNILPSRSLSGNDTYRLPFETLYYLVNFLQEIYEDPEKENYYYDFEDGVISFKFFFSDNSNYKFETSAEWLSTVFEVVNNIIGGYSYSEAVFAGNLYLNNLSCIAFTLPKFPKYAEDLGIVLTTTFGRQNAGSYIDLGSISLDRMLLAPHVLSEGEPFMLQKQSLPFNQLFRGRICYHSASIQIGGDSMQVLPPVGMVCVIDAEGDAPEPNRTILGPSMYFPDDKNVNLITPFLSYEDVLFKYSINPVTGTTITFWKINELDVGRIKSYTVVPAFAAFEPNSANEFSKPAIMVVVEDAAELSLALPVFESIAWGGIGIL